MRWVDRFWKFMRFRELKAVKIDFEEYHNNLHFRNIDGTEITYDDEEMSGEEQYEVRENRTF